MMAAVAAVAAAAVAAVAAVAAAVAAVAAVVAAVGGGGGPVGGGGGPVGGGGNGGNGGGGNGGNGGDGSDGCEGGYVVDVIWYEQDDGDRHLQSGVICSKYVDIDSENDMIGYTGADGVFDQGEDTAREYIKVETGLTYEEAIKRAPEILIETICELPEYDCSD